MTKYLTPLQKIARLPEKLCRHVARNGLRGAGAWCCYQVAWRLRERRMGIDTRERAYGIAVGDKGECHGYEPIEHRTFDIILDHLNVAPGAGSFIDYGCGMGRAVILAATRPFRRVLGVEIDPVLCEVARRQVAQAQERGRLCCGQVEILCHDAAALTLPPDVNYVFLYNSFTGALLHAVLEQIRRSVADDPRELTLIYVQPVADEDTLARAGWLHRQCELPTGFWDHIRTTVYQADPAACQTACRDAAETSDSVQRVSPITAPDGRPSEVPETACPASV